MNADQVKQEAFDKLMNDILNPPKPTFFQKRILPFVPVLFVAIRLTFAALVLWGGSVLASQGFSWVPELSYLNAFGWVLILDVVSGFVRRGFAGSGK